ncbi:hypothetical protein H5410_006356 [Solanum commersonii]|uniref:Uncharacterized protein n=1 Tax=Solanum commersonii TaxID=4109 RepID=A0A9J6AA71_SOLCO|nr:hypothetical protein H5410_006356 [Solanum commersonii]
MNWVQRKIYLYNVTFGLYMLDWWERCLFNILVLVLLWFMCYNGFRFASELFNSKLLHCWHQEDAMVAKEVLLAPVHLSMLGQGTNKKQTGRDSVWTKTVPCFALTTFFQRHPGYTSIAMSLSCICHEWLGLLFPDPLEILANVVKVHQLSRAKTDMYASFGI